MIQFEKSSVGKYLLKQKKFWEIFSRAMFYTNSPLVQELQIDNQIYLQNLSLYGHFTEDISFLILTIQGEKSEMFFDKWISDFKNKNQNIPEWLAYGKRIFENTIIYDSDYNRKYC